MPILSKQLLTCVLQSLYFEDQLEARLACKEWNVIIEPLLVCVKDDYSLTLKERENFGKYICESQCNDNHFKTLNEIKNIFPNLKYLQLDYIPIEDGETKLLFDLLRYFSDAGVLISFKSFCQLPCELLVNLKLNSIDSDSLWDNMDHLATLNQPHLEKMSLFYNCDSKTDELDAIISLVNQNFPSLKVLKLSIAGDGRNMAKIVSSFKALKKLELTFNGYVTISLDVQQETSIKHLNLRENTYQSLQDNFTGFLLKGVRKLSIIVTNRICPRVELMFPGIKVLTFQQSRYHNREGIPNAFYITGPISVQSLNMKIESYDLICNYQVKWPTVLSVSLACRSLSVFKCAINWIFTCFSSVEAITLKVPEYFLQEAFSFQFLKKKNCSSLRCIYSNTGISFNFIKLLKEGAPNLMLVACPMDPETKIK
ncbi:hypothetical protein DSO57_1008420 [Entomophthora muscae]|nr:hypothetical protein DSO57_1008420 [Entomophthora muscae]